MKLLKLIMVTLGLMVAAFATEAQNTPYSIYATTGSAYGGGTLTNSAIIGANSTKGGSPVLTYLNVSSASSASVVQLYSCSNHTYAAAATTNVRTNTVGNTNGFSAGTVVVIRHLANDTYERMLLNAPQLTNQITFASDPVMPLAIGDLIYQQTATATISVTTNAGTGTFWLNLLGTGIYAGQPQSPLLLDMISGNGTNGAIKAACATFSP